MTHHTLTTTFRAPRDEVFAYLADIEKLPEWATEFARELKVVDGRYKVVNGLGEFFFEIRADRESGVIDMLAGPNEDALALFPTRVVPLPTAGAPSRSRCSKRRASRRSSSRASSPRFAGNSATSNVASAGQAADLGESPQSWSYSSRRRNHGPVSLRPFGARSSHWYIAQSPSTPREYAE